MTESPDPDATTRVSDEARTMGRSSSGTDGAPAVTTRPAADPTAARRTADPTAARPAADPTAAPPDFHSDVAPRTGATKFVVDTAAVFTREILLVLRDPFTLIFSLLQPLIFLGLFGPLLTGAVGGMAGGGMAGGETGGGGTTADTLQWFVPGVIVMISLFGTTMTGANLLYEMMTGSYERQLATPLARSAILVGRALKEFAPLVVQGLIITLLCVPFGFALYPLQLVAGLVLLGLFGVGVGALSYALGLASKNREWLFWGVQQSLLFPLLILSGMMLPLEAGPDWMQTVAKFNPLTYIVDAERTLLAGTFADTTVLWGVVAAALTCAVGLWVGIRRTRRTI